MVAYKEFLINLDSTLNLGRASDPSGGVSRRRTHHYSRRTVNRKLACLGAFYEHLFMKGLVKENPTRRLRRFKVSKDVVTVDLSDEQVRRLFEVIDVSTSAGILHRAVLSVLFSTGMRHGELVNLKFENLVQENEFVVFKYFGKGDKGMVTPLNERVLSHLGEYLEWCKGRGYSFSKSDYLFRPTKNPRDGELNKRLSSKSVGYMMRKYCKIIGVEGKVTVHSARSTVIGMLLDKGVGIEKVAEFVGHSDLGTTKAYNKRKTKIGDSPAFEIDF
jgi:site-specific recombinase XerD